MADSFIKTFFVLSIIGIIGFMAFYNFGANYFSEYGVSLGGSGNDTADIFNDIDDYSNSITSQSEGWKDGVSNVEGTGDFSEKAYTSSFFSVKDMLTSVYEPISIIPKIGSAIGIPTYITGLFITIIIFIFVIAVILLFVRGVVL